MACRSLIQKISNTVCREPGSAYLQGLAQGANLGLQSHVVIRGVAPLAAQRGHLPRQHALVRLHLTHVRHQPLVLSLQCIDLQGPSLMKRDWCDAVISAASRGAEPMKCPVHCQGQSSAP